MHEDHLSYGKSFSEALEGLFTKRAETESIFSPVDPDAPSFNDLILQANQAFESYLDGLAERRFDASSDALEELQDALHQLSEQAADETESTRE